VVATVCAQLATGTSQGLRESKLILNRELVRRIDEYGAEMAALSAHLFATDEAREAMTAFLNRTR
jgi:enoyl-CoA hydratase/methylglutaconyl-CoA hydratase